MILKPLIIFITGLLVILWGYAAFSKLFNLEKFRHAMRTQVFPKWIGKILVYLVPASEIVITILLFIPTQRLIGMYLSFFLMLSFTIYVGGAIFGLYDRRPCACGGLFGGLGWKRHFKVNVILTLIALMGIILMKL